MPATPRMFFTPRPDGPAMADPVVRARDVWKSYDGREDVLRGVDLDVAAAEAVLVFGPNGSGKTTLLSILGGLDVPSRGSVTIGGREISHLKESALAKIRLHDVGFVFQTHNLIDDLTVEENVALPLRLARKPSDVRVADLLATFQIARLATRRPKEISVGEAQRVAVARALANGPKVILADEPTASLDLKGTTAVLEAFQLARSSYRTAVVVAYRFYTSNDAGYAIAMLNTLTFLAGVATLGMPVALIRFLPEMDNPSALVNSVMTVSGAIVFVLSLAFIVGLPIWAPGLVVQFWRPEYVPIVVVTAVAYTFGPILDQAAIAARRADLYLWRIVIFSVTKVPLPLVFALWLGAALGQIRVLGIYMSWSIAFGVSVLAAA